MDEMFDMKHSLDGSENNINPDLSQQPKLHHLKPRF